MSSFGMFDACEVQFDAVTIQKQREQMVEIRFKFEKSIWPLPKKKV